jgi:hypothetical protein
MVAHCSRRLKSLFAPAVQCCHLRLLTTIAAAAQRCVYQAGDGHSDGHDVTSQVHEEEHVCHDGLLVGLKFSGPAGTA